nr:unnamed protein product [Digitaria exilis]
MRHTRFQCLPHQAMALLEVKRTFASSSNDPSMTLPLSDRDLTGNVPIHLAELIDLVSLDLSFNDDLRLHEPSFQTIIANLSKLNKLHLDRVKISSTAADCFRAMAKSITQLEILTMPGCKLSGPIHFGDRVNNLESLYLSFNSLSGTIPLSLFTHPALNRLDLSRNQFSGALGEFSNPSLTLVEVDLSVNQLGGPVPKSFARLAALESLSLDHNYFTDTFPSWIGELPHLRVLVLRSNQLYGSLSSLEENLTMEYFQDLQIIDIGNNTLNGALPTNLFQSSKLMTHPAGSGGGIYATSPESDEWFRPYLIVVNVAMKELYIDVSKIQADFVLIDLSHNRFHGPIPTTIGKLSALHVLNMSGNAFTG